MNHVTMVGCAIAGTAVLTALDAWSQPEVHAGHWPITSTSPVLPDPANYEGEPGEASRLNASVQPPRGALMPVEGDSDWDLAAIGPAAGATTHRGSGSSTSVRAQGFSPAVLVRATVPSDLPGDRVCMLNHDTGDVTLVNLAEFGGPLPHGRDAEPSIQPDPGVLQSAIIQSICFTPEDWLHGTGDTLRNTDVGSRAAARLGAGLNVHAHGFAPIPEPNTLAFVGLGPLALAALRRRA